MDLLKSIIVECNEELSFLEQHKDSLFKAEMGATIAGGLYVQKFFFFFS